MTEPLETRYEGRFLRMVARGHWEFVERANSTGVVAVLAVTPDEKILLVEQFRPPVDCSVIEIPAGLAGDIAGEENEDFSTAAVRELAEESGYEPEEVRFLGAGPSSAGLTNECISFYEATKIKKVGDGGGDESESIIVHEVPLIGLRAWLNERAECGAMIDPKIFAALAMAGRNFS
ncbi:MAG: NUDIX hydrolase [Planctomycetes bacterium]|nr:NUDIX hydrolase [Planctomycetota bacterium]